MVKASNQVGGASGIAADQLEFTSFLENGDQRVSAPEDLAEAVHNFADLSRSEQVQTLRALQERGLETEKTLLSSQIPRMEAELSNRVERGTTDPTYDKIHVGHTVVMIVEQPDGDGLSRSDVRHQSMLADYARTQDSNVTIHTFDPASPDLSDLELGEESNSAFVRTTDEGDKIISGESASLNGLTKRLLTEIELSGVHLLGKDELINLQITLAQQSYSLKIVGGTVLKPSGYSTRGSVVLKQNDQISRYRCQDIRFVAITGIATNLDEFVTPPEDFVYRGKSVRVWDFINGEGWIDAVVTEPDAHGGGISLLASNSEDYQVTEDSAYLDLRDPNLPENSELLPDPHHDGRTILYSSPVRITTEGEYDWGVVRGLNLQGDQFQTLTPSLGFTFHDREDTTVEFIPRDAQHPTRKEVRRGSILTVLTEEGRRDVYEIKGVDVPKKRIIANMRMGTADTPSFQNLSFSELQSPDVQVYELDWNALEEIHPGIREATNRSHLVSYQTADGIRKGKLLSPKGLPAFLVVQPIEYQSGKGDVPFSIEVDLADVVEMIPLEK